VSLLLQALLVFVAVGIADVCWAKYIAACSAKERWIAASWAAAISIGGLFSVIECTGNRWMVIPAVLGSFMGTAWAVPRKAEAS
jgi:hypothetical protein